VSAVFSKNIEVINLTKMEFYNKKPSGSKQISLLDIFGGKFDPFLANN
jgi:hypothetical protein